MKKSQPKSNPGSLSRRIFAKIRKNKLSFAVYVVMCIITCAVIVLAIDHREWSSVFTAVLALILFMLPAFVEESLRIELPSTLEIIVMLFVFCAEILGEIGMYYTKYPFWDTMLHCISGFLFAAFGFSLVDICNRNRRIHFSLSPFFLALVACCFALAVGVVWEFFEFFMDSLVHTDMQKDTVVTVIASGLLHPDGQTPVTVSNITQTVITTADGTVYTVNGFLDIGLLDTMEDLIVDFIGALVFSVIGFFYVRHRGQRGKLARQFIPQVPGATASDPGAATGDASDSPAEQKSE